MLRFLRLIMRADMILAGSVIMLSLVIFVLMILASVKAKKTSSLGSGLMLAGSISGLFVFLFLTVLNQSISSIISTIGTDYIHYIFLASNIIASLTKLLFVVGILIVLDSIGTNRTNPAPKL